MKLLWISPRGTGLDLAARLRGSGHQVVVYGEGAGLPLVKQKDLYKFAELSDLTVIDGSFPLVRTRRSWRPHQDALFFDELRRQYHTICLGPTPTIDLLCGDKRYLRKWCRKLGISYSPNHSESGVAGLVESKFTEGGADGPSVSDFATGGWFRDSRVSSDDPLLTPWRPLFKSVGFRGWFRLSGQLSGSGPVVSAASADWPTSDIPDDRAAEFLMEMANG